MGWRRIERYREGIQVSAESAWTDGLHLDFGDWLIGPVSDDVAHGIFNMLLPARNTGEQQPFFDVQVSATPEAPWFIRPGSQFLFNPRLDIRGSGRGHGLHPGTPLVSGELKTKRVGPGLSIRKLRLNLFLNATRFIHHQEQMPWAIRPIDQWRLPPANLLSGASLIRLYEEISLDGNDNVLIGRAAVQYGRKAWRMHIERYWAAIRCKFNTLVADAADAFAIPCRHDSTVRLKKAETYWEFHVPDPLAWVKQVEPCLRQIGLSSQARTFSYEHGLALDGLRYNSRSITVRIRSGVKLRVYAKTTHRVRFEIEHDLKENASVLGGRRTSERLDDLHMWLHAISHDAAQHVNQVLQHLDHQAIRRGNQFSTTQFICRLTQVVGEPELAEMILDILAANGSIVSQGIRLNRAISALKRAGVLEAVTPGARRSIVTMPYRAALDNLVGHIARGATEFSNDASWP